MTPTKQQWLTDLDGSSVFPIIPPSLNDLNLPPNPSNILAKMAAVNHSIDGNGDNYSPQSPEPSDPSPISKPPMNVSTFNSWETPQTTTDDNTFYSEDEPQRVYWTSPLDMIWKIRFWLKEPKEWSLKKVTLVTLFYFVYLSTWCELSLSCFELRFFPIVHEEN